MQLRSLSLLIICAFESADARFHSKAPEEKNVLSVTPTDPPVPSPVPSSLDVDLVSIESNVPSKSPSITSSHEPSVSPSDTSSNVPSEGPTIHSSILNTRHIGSTPKPKDVETPKPTHAPSSLPSSFDFNTFSTNSPALQPAEEPSFSPSVYPTTSYPSNPPTMGKSLNPTLSLAGNTEQTLSPTMTTPSRLPTLPPTLSNSQFDPLCQQTSTDADSQFYGKMSPQGLEITYKYEIEIDSSKSASSTSDILQDLEDAITQRLLAVFANCGTSSDLALRRTLRRRELQDSGVVVGFSPSPKDSPIENEICEDASKDTVLCNVVDGSLTLYLSDSSNSSFHDKVYSQVVESLRAGMGDEGDLLKAHVAIVKLTLLETAKSDIIVEEGDDDGRVDDRERRDPTITPDGRSDVPLTIGVAMGSVSFLLLGAGLTFWCRKRSRRNSYGHKLRSSDEPDSDEYESESI